MSIVSTLSWVTVAAVAFGGGGVLLDRRADLKEAETEARFPPEGQFVEVDGRQVHAVVTGTGPDLVLLHGAGGNTRDFTYDFVNAVKDRYRVIVFDRPGHGWTEQTRESLDSAWSRDADGPEAQAAFLHAASRQLGVETPIVLGQSFGGAVAMAWALNHDPAAVVMVAGVSHPWPGGLSATYTAPATRLGGGILVPLIAAFPPNGYIPRVLNRVFAPQAVPDGYQHHFGARLAMRRNTLRANSRQVTTLRPHIVEMSERYTALTLPIEAVHGTADTIVPLTIHSVPLSDRVQSAHLTALDGIGHMPQHAAQDDVIAAIDRAARRAGLH